MHGVCLNKAEHLRTNSRNSASRHLMSIFRTNSVRRISSWICFTTSTLHLRGGADTIFDRIDQNDVVLAFFPCTRFECQIKLHMSGDSYGLNKWTDERKLNYAMKLHKELCLFYRTFARMFIVAIRKGIKMIVENPYTQPHYLTAYFPIKPTMLDKDRSMNGDYYKKPTQYWFINCKPQTNMLLEAEDWRSPITIDNPSINGASRTTSRSMIHPSYARKFIYNNILTKQQIKEGGTL